MNRKTANQEQDIEATSVRPVRVPVGSRPRMSVVGKNPNFEYRWVNDYPGRIADFKRGGWEVCTNEEVDTGNFRVEEGGSPGSLACQVVNGGDGTKAYVMKIHKDLYDEDQKAQEQEVRRTEETLTPNTNDGEYGSVVIDRSGRK